MDISVVVPLFNEEESLRELHLRLNKTLQTTGRNWEIVFVDDGSSDDSYRVIKELAAADDHIRAIRFRHNSGKAAALNAGFEAAEGTLVFTMDADLQDDPKEIPRFIEKLEGENLDLVSGWKKKRHDPVSKTLPSKLFNWATSVMCGVRLHDFNCGFKLYRRDVVKDVNLYGELHRYVPAIAHLKGYRVGEMVVEHHARKFGKSKYGLERLTRGLFDLMTVMFLGRYRTRPLHLFGGIGLIFSMGGAVIDAYVLSLKIRFGNIQNHSPLLLGGILLTLLGIQFICTGLLAEMITGLSARQSKDYSVRETLG